MRRFSIVLIAIVLLVAAVTADAKTHDEEWARAKDIMDNLIKISDQNELIEGEKVPHENDLNAFGDGPNKSRSKRI